jgi:hypothetical protein
MERRLAAILCADVHGYSRLMWKSKPLIKNITRGLKFSRMAYERHAVGILKLYAARARSCIVDPKTLDYWFQRF